MIALFEVSEVMQDAVFREQASSMHNIVQLVRASFIPRASGVPVLLFITKDFFAWVIIKVFRWYDALKHLRVAVEGVPSKQVVHLHHGLHCGLQFSFLVSVGSGVLWCGQRADKVVVSGELSIEVTHPNGHNGGKWSVDELFCLNGEVCQE